MSVRPALEELIESNPALGAIERGGPVCAQSGELSPSEALRRLPDRYFGVYPARVVARHVELLSSLSAEEPYALDAGRTADGLYDLTIVTIDRPGILSLLTGTIGAAGFNVRSGSVFTLSRETVRASGRGWRARQTYSSRTIPVVPSRRIVDRFVGSIDPQVDPARFFGTVSETLDRVIPLALPGGDMDAARRLVNEAVAERLRTTDPSSGRTLLPLGITFEPGPEATRMVIDGQDTPFFLYALSTALSLQGISVESVSIETRGQVVSDVFDLVDSSGSPIREAASLDQVRLCVLLTKQFTHFLGQAPDPYGALVRFESMSRDLVGQAGRSGVEILLNEPQVLGELARILGASDFLWEDFVRLQYESIIPMLSGTGTDVSIPSERMESTLAGLMASAEPPERRGLLNEFKDRQAFLIDLDHILRHDRDFLFLSDRLSSLAEVVVAAALRIAWDEITPRYGVPRTVAGMPAPYAVFGLGKLGGRALGYASDIELLFVYGDNGTTDGPEQIDNAEFFERFFTAAAGSIESRRAGIFQVDLRLRPFGTAGPTAVSLESFNRYYRRDGEAHSYERLALTRLRAIAGDTDLGRRVEQVRDALVYATDSIDLAEVRALRERQLAEKAGNRLNAKFSPGGLVDLEYGLQILLVQHGRANPRLRTASLHAALEELQRSGLLDREETARLVRAYQFLRNLINGLRMLRGNAQDLFLPQAESLEFAHLARRSGYRQEGGLSPSEQLRVEFEARTAAVRAFLEHHLGREQIPGPGVGNAADLVLSPALDHDLAVRITREAGIRDHLRAVRNLRLLAGEQTRLEVFTELVILAWTALRQVGDADRALNNWERFVCALDDPVLHYRELLRQPRMLELLLHVMSTSQFLAETLIANPAFLKWSLDPEVVSSARDESRMYDDLTASGFVAAEPPARRERIRTFRKREILRIGTRDLCLNVPLAVVTAELSALARTIVRADLEAIWSSRATDPASRTRFCILAFGKLGGCELNYSSDIDLFGVYEDAADAAPEAEVRLYSDVVSELRADLSDHTGGGHAYRVDFRLRPHGRSGPLVQPVSAVLHYYEHTAAPWEHQALLKLSPVAGDLELGRRLVDRLRQVSARSLDAATVHTTIRRHRATAVARSARRGDDIKSGEGGIRDIEFLVQALQLVHAAARPGVCRPNTLEALERLREIDLLTEAEESVLRRDYEYLRRVEHYLQIFEDRQVHNIPDDPLELDLLARRLLGSRATGEQFLADLTTRRARVRELFDRLTSSPPRDDG